jgi:hypothetical protein
VVDVSGGAFTPGAGAEATGAADVEFALDLGANPTSAPDTLAAQGTGGADRYRLGTRLAWGRRSHTGA